MAFAVYRSFIFATQPNLLQSNAEENIKFDDSSYNRMKDVGNLKIEVGSRPPFWILIFESHSLNCRNSNTTENTSSVILAATEVIGDFR